MPFMDIDRPSIQLGLLKALVQHHGFPVNTLHANLDFAARIGVEAYRKLSEHRGRMIGDWLFSIEAFGRAAPDPTASLLDDLADDLSYLGGARSAELLLDIRDRQVPAYLNDLVASYEWGVARVVGFTSTFQQNAASFALARRLKERWPHLLTVFGGANFDGEMGIELIRCLECIDFAVIGEGDVAFPALLAALAGGDLTPEVPGVAYRMGPTVAFSPAGPPMTNLDESPVPDYAEYFEHARELQVLPAGSQRTVWLPIEGSRGCWWGAKHHCTFCGLNGDLMQFRSKSVDRMVGELAQQARRYHTTSFQAIDNILDTNHLRNLLPRLVADGTNYQLFYEVKANLTREQVKLMAQAGLTHVQPGLESLSTHVLGLLRKGVRAIQNVNVLRWCRYYGIDVAWNILYGASGEDAADYREQSELIPHLHHLQPPGDVVRIWMERFSPLYTDADQFKVRVRRPEASYRYVYPACFDLDKIAYFFDYELIDALPAATYDGLQAATADWSAGWTRRPPPALTYWSAPGFLKIYDARHPGREGSYVFEGVIADIYLACSDRPISAAAVLEVVGAATTVAEVREVFGEFARRGLMMCEGSQALALALPAVLHR